MKKTLIALVAVLAAAVIALPASAITDGSLDGDAHPYVGLMVAQDSDGNPLWRCSGTLISPTLFLTAGHCTEAPAAHAEIWFDADVQSGVPGNGYPNTGDVGGTTFTHPQYDPNAFYLHDLGVVVLDTPVVMSAYGSLPTLNQLDALKSGKVKQDTFFTAVGYGLQKAFPDAASWKDQALKVRMVSYPRLIQINTGYTGDGSMILSNNANTGGTCFGDSGGPIFMGDSNVVAGVTSFGKNGTCAGQGGVYRVDRADDLDWLATFAS
jgi:V8-like Glu-specific endopeptidase